MITRLRVKNYKSLKDLDLRLRPLTVFVGPNNAGKSNIIDIFMLLSQLTSEGPNAIVSRGDFSELVWNGELRRSIALTVDGKTKMLEGKRYQNFIYELELIGNYQTYTLKKEHLSIHFGKQQKKILEFDAARREHWAIAFDGSQESGEHRYSASDLREIGLGRFRNPERYGAVGEFARSVMSWNAYNLDIRQMRVPRAARREMQLRANGENVALVLQTLQTEEPARFSRLRDLLQAIVPEITSLSSPVDEQGRIVVQVKEEGLTKSMPIWALSDGTLHTLALLCAVYAPKPPDVMCFEEPENYIHPRALGVIAEAFQEASQRSQIIISTYSPYLLNLFQPEDLVIIEKERGSTRAKPASRQKGLQEALSVLGLGEAWYSGSIGGVP